MSFSLCLTSTLPKHKIRAEQWRNSFAILVGGGDCEFGFGLPAVHDRIGAWLSHRAACWTNKTRRTLLRCVLTQWGLELDVHEILRAARRTKFGHIVVMWHMWPSHDSCYRDLPIYIYIYISCIFVYMSLSSLSRWAAWFCWRGSSNSRCALVPGPWI